MCVCVWVAFFMLLDSVSVFFPWFEKDQMPDVNLEQESSSATLQSFLALRVPVIEK